MGRAQQKAIPKELDLVCQFTAHRIGVGNQVHRGVLQHTFNGEFGHRIGCGRRTRCEASNTAEVDNSSAALRSHEWKCGFDHSHSTIHIGLELRIKLLLACLGVSTFPQHPIDHFERT